jgi:hypothetical protein
MDERTAPTQPRAKSAHDVRLHRRVEARARLRRHRLLLTSAFVLLALAFVAPALPGTGRILGGEDLMYFRPPFSEKRPADLAFPHNALLADAVEVFHPDLAWVVDRVRHGAAPLWNPNVGAGWPQLASQQTAPLFPLNLLAYVLPFWSSLGLIAALRILLAASGTFLFCRRILGMRTTPAALAAIAYAAGTYNILWLEHPHGNVYALLPLLLLVVDRIIRRPSAGRIGVMGAVLGLALLGGHPQSVLLEGFLVAPYAAWRMTPIGRHALGQAANPARVVLALAGGCVIGLAAAAVVLLPLLEFIHASTTQQRGGLGGIKATALLSVALPDLWGRPDGGFQGRGPINYFERTIYVGTPALLLAVTGLAMRRCSAQVFFAIMAVVGAVLAISPPVVTDVVDRVPPFSLVAMIRALVITTFCLAVLAGYGLQRVLEADRAQLRRALLIAAVVAAAPPLLIGFARARSLGALGDGVHALPGLPGNVETENGAIVGSALRWTALAVASLSLMAALYTRPSLAPALALVLVALQAGDLVEIGRGLHPIVDDRVVKLTHTATLGRAMNDEGTARTIGEEYYLLPNEGSRFGLRDPRVRGQPTIARVDQLYAAYTGVLPRWFDLDAPRAGDMLDAFGVGQVLTGARASDPANPELTLVRASIDDRLYRNAGALPRAYVATSWRTADDETEGIRMTVGSSSVDLRTAPVVEQASASPPPAGRAAAGTAQFTVDGDNRVLLDVQTATPGRLVLLDAVYPGWKATVNGEDVTIAPTNGAFRSVRVPAGRSVVEFRYRPISVYAGAAISGAAWLVLLSGLGVALARRRRTARRA